MKSSLSLSRASSKAMGLPNTIFAVRCRNMTTSTLSTRWGRPRCGCASCNPIVEKDMFKPSTPCVSGRFYSGSKFQWSSETDFPSEATMSLGINSTLTNRKQKLNSINRGTNSGDSGTDYGSIPSLFALNRAWSEETTKREPKFFEVLSKQQNPRYLWIGCSDSRVPANEVVGLRPGELFVHRNVANVVVHTDLNCLSVVQYAVEALRVEHIIVCGHYGCGGVKAALNRNRLGLIDNWLRHVIDVKDKHKFAVESTPYPEQLDLLCELNVIEQTFNICETTIVQDAWSRGQNLQIHSWIYGINNGLLKDLGLHVSHSRELENTYEKVLKGYASN